MEKLTYDSSKFTYIGSMNYILQIWGNVNNNEGIATVDQYQPRRNRIWNGEMPIEDVKRNISETIERMKCVANLMQYWLDGKIDNVYYWEEQKQENQQ